MGEKQIAGGDDKPKDDPRAGGPGKPGEGPGQGGDGGDGGKDGPGGPGGPGKGPGPLIDPMPEGPKPQQIITGKKKEPDKKQPIQFPRPGGGGGRKLDG
ncbi:MAG TPA: hypothetical protein VFC31_06585 [Candidatus Limnocylindria bacterium]|nr:hypothetical protein [Candidatus Limnocylindria bacterium]